MSNPHYANQAISSQQQYAAQVNNQSANVVKDPRLHVINGAITTAEERVRQIAQAINLKADSIVGTAPTGTSEGATPSPVPNGALDQIERSLHALSDALDGLADAERRFAGLA